MEQPTLDQVQSDIQRAEQAEVELFFAKSRELYDMSSAQGEELYDIAAAATDDFARVGAETLVADPRIIKILRYMLVPVVSQMKLGQLIGESSTTSYERNRKLPAEKATRLAVIFDANLDRDRLIWQQVSLPRAAERLAKEYAKRWTCSLMANQNSATSFRSWRRDVQETKVSDAILAAAYSPRSARTVIRSPNDVLVGEFCRETRVQGKSVQKADFVVRVASGKILLAIEAKAVGVKIDAYKRIKEVRDKSGDWRGTFGDRVQVAAVLAGFVPLGEVQSLLDSGVLVFWEHRLSDLTDHLREG